MKHRFFLQTCLYKCARGVGGNTPEHHPPTEACMIHSKRHRGCGVQGPGTRGYRGWKTADFSHSAGTAHGAPPLTRCCMCVSHPGITEGGDIIVSPSTKPLNMHSFPGVAW